MSARKRTLKRFRFATVYGSSVLALTADKDLGGMPYRRAAGVTEYESTFGPEFISAARALNRRQSDG